MKISPHGTNPTSPGPESYFTGRVRFDTPFAAETPGRAGGAIVTFEPGARTAWHTHPLGQTLIVTNGIGWCQTEGGPIHEIRPGDVIWFAPDERHWHGASATTAMTHIAIAEAVEGSRATWLDHVPDHVYDAGPDQ